MGERDIMLNAKITVGVTIFLRKDHQSIWENGIFQNCYFLLMLLNKSPIVEKAYLVNGGDGTPEPSNAFLALSPAPLIDMVAAKSMLNVVIELSAQLNGEWAAEFKSRGGKIVGMHVANDYVIDIERMVFNLPSGMLFSNTPYDVIWTLPAFERTCRAYYEGAFRAPVQVMQHLWNPVLLERSGERNPRRFAYEQKKGRRRVGIFEPNICTVKTSHLAMLVVDLAHRQDPLALECLRVYNALQFRDDPTFVGFARSLNVFKHGMATVEGRFPIYDVLLSQVDFIVSHQLENAQNYLYYEALFGGFPLIHNSILIGSCGYYYPDFNCEAGASALLQACAQHDLGLADYKRDAHTFLAQLDPEADRNVRDYSAALEALY